MLTILILAAGASSRMGVRDKLTLPIHDQPMLAVMIERAQATQCPVLVALPPDRPHRTAIVKESGAASVIVPNAKDGMGVSIATATAARPKGTSALMVLPADMPALTTKDLESLKHAWEAAPKDAILRAMSAEGRPGHPVIFPATCFSALETLRGDQGARRVVAAHDGPVIDVALPGDHALLDIDTPDEWRAFEDAAKG